MIRVVRSLVAAVLAWGIAFAPVAAAAQQASSVAKPDAPSDNDALAAAVAEIKASNPQKAVNLLDPVITRIERDLASEKRKVYCGMAQTETLAYMAQAAAGKQDAIAIAPTLCEALFLKAFSLVDLDRVDAAQAIFQRLTALAPLHSQYFSELGNTYRLQKNWAASLAAYESAESSATLADKSDVPTRQCIALRGQGYVLVELGKWDEAERAYRKCLKAIPGEPKSLGELGYIKQHRGK